MASAAVMTMLCNVACWSFWRVLRASPDSVPDTSMTFAPASSAAFFWSSIAVRTAWMPAPWNSR